MENKLYLLEKKIGVTFKDKNLLKKSLIRDFVGLAKNVQLYSNIGLKIVLLYEKKVSL